MKKAKKKAKRSAPLKATIAREPKAAVRKRNDEKLPVPQLDVTVRTIRHEDQFVPALCFRLSTDQSHATAIVGDRIGGIRAVRLSIREHDRADLTQHGHGTLAGPYPVALFARHMHTLAHNGATLTSEARELLTPLVPSPLPTHSPPPDDPLGIAATLRRVQTAKPRPAVQDPDPPQRPVERPKAPKTPQAALHGPSRLAGKELIRMLADEFGLPSEKVRAKLRAAGLRAPYTDEAACRKAMEGM